MIDEKEIQVRCLLASSWLLTMSRAVIAPLLVLTLGRQLSLNGEQTGLLLGGVLLLSALMGLYGGHLLDHWPRRPVLLGSVALIALNYLVLPLSQQLWWSALALALSEIGQAVHSIAIKALISDLLPPERRGKAFSLRYTLANVGWALGAAAVQPAAGLGRRLAVLVRDRVGRGGRPGDPARFLCASPGGRRSGSGLSGDAGPFAARPGAGLVHPELCLGQLGVRPLFQLSAPVSDAVAAGGRGVALDVGADQLQRGWRGFAAISAGPADRGLRFDESHRRRFPPAGAGDFGLGLGARGLLGMCAAMLVFTVGEIVLVPAEYLYIDAIAPEDCKGVYYGAQNLASLGGALGPMLAGWMLARASGGVLFAVMASLCMLAWWLALRGEALRQARSIGCWQAAALKI
ncbi:MFS transporter [Chromobacterium haemolyticum]|nr:MFS transporter [Chromobacterium haemolyticum]